MGKGGDQTTTASTSDYNSTIKPYATDLLSKAQTVSNQPYTTYQGPRLADFSPDTQTAFGDIRAQAANGGGINAVNTGIGAAGNLTGFQANPITSTNVGSSGFGDLTPDQLAKYMNPYTQNVIDVQKQQANQDYQEQQAGRDASAVQAGAFGGDRRFVANSLAQRDLNNQLQTITSTGLNTGFNNAANLFETDEARREATGAGNADRSLSAQTANEAARLNAGNLGLNAASTLGVLGQTKNDLGLQNAEALSGVGSKIQQQQQAGLDLGYQNFIDQRDWPAKQLQLYSQLLSGQPVTPSTTTTTTAPAPDFLSQLAGLTTSGLGLAKLLQGTGA